MIDYRVTLVDRNGARGRWGLLEPAPSVARPADLGRRRLERQYRALIADPAWLPEAPVRVLLARADENAAPAASDFELAFFAEPAPSGKGRGIIMLAALASMLSLPRPAGAAQSEAARPSRPPSVYTSEPGPPTRHLVKESRKVLEPLRGRDGKPVLLSPMHTNVSPAAHTNLSGVHTNVWSNHSNVSPTSTPNPQSVHSNLPPYNIPHTNITPGDWVF
ncbi:MAG: hypothetical protein FJX76_19495 [Armatimonadetes bacterium]|nr:hypothetical protein [Armatimonadota bacterium]